MKNPPALHNLVRVYELTCMSKMQLFFKYHGTSERCKLLIGPEKHTVSDKVLFTSNFLVQKKTIINENQSGPVPAYCRTTKI